MIKRDRRGHSYCGIRGEILGSLQDELLQKHLPRMFSLPGLGTPAMALVSFNSMYLFGYSLEHVFIQ